MVYNGEIHTVSIFGQFSLFQIALCRSTSISSPFMYFQVLLKENFPLIANFQFQPSSLMLESISILLIFELNMEAAICSYVFQIAFCIILFTFSFDPKIKPKAGLFAFLEFSRGNFLNDNIVSR